MHSPALPWELTAALQRMIQSWLGLIHENHGGGKDEVILARISLPLLPGRLSKGLVSCKVRYGAAMRSRCSTSVARTAHKLLDAVSRPF